MKLLKVGNGKYVNSERITYIEAKKRDKVIIQFHNEVTAGGIGIPTSYLELKGTEAEDFLRWLDTHSESALTCQNVKMSASYTNPYEHRFAL
jgi:hypothetical protein